MLFSTLESSFEADIVSDAAPVEPRLNCYLFLLSYPPIHVQIPFIFTEGKSTSPATDEHPLNIRKVFI